MSGVRRVKKGPGRRPLTAQRQRFMELLDRGVSISAAARMVGVSRSAATGWTRGYKVYRRGEVVGFVPPLERRAVRQVSGRYLSQDERLVIADRHRAGVPRSTSPRSSDAHQPRSRGNCAATPPAATTSRSGRSVSRSNAAVAAIHAGSTPTLPWGIWSPASSRAVGARSRSAGGCARRSPISRACGCATRASTRPSTNRTHAGNAQHRSRRYACHP